MATKSIMKTIVIKDNRAAYRLTKAMEVAKNVTSKEVIVPHKVDIAEASDISYLFSGISNDRN